MLGFRVLGVGPRLQGVGFRASRLRGRCTGAEVE